MNLFEVTTLGQPLEVIKTQMAANRSQTMGQAFATIWSRGGIKGFYQGLIPWVGHAEGPLTTGLDRGVDQGRRPALRRGGNRKVVDGGVWPVARGGRHARRRRRRYCPGVCHHGYVGNSVELMPGFCTCMKTVEITRHKQAVAGAAPEGTFKVFMDIYRREGIAGINKGVNAVAVRQATNWGSRMGFARLAEQGLRRIKGIKENERLGALDKIMASTLGGALATWNQPIEVVRVEVCAPKGLSDGRCNRP